MASNATSRLPEGVIKGPQARQYDRRNPTFSKAQTGVESNHSSAEPSTKHSENIGHTQQDDDLQNIPPPQDPNISGNPDMSEMHSWQAGAIDGWCENDDYREYFEKSRGCDGMLACDPMDSDYDDNGGMPTAVGHSRGQRAMPTISYGDHPDGGFALGPVIIRRI